MAKVNYRPYVPALNARNIELLADADEYFQDVVETLNGVDSPQVFVTAWVLKPGIMMSAAKSFQDLIRDTLKKPNAVCRVLINTNAPGQLPGVLETMARRFRDHVRAGLPPGQPIDSKLKIILSANLNEHLGFFFERVLAAERTRRAPKPPPENTAKAWHLKIWDDLFGKEPRANTLHDAAVATHHQKTITILGQKNGQPHLVSYCGGLDVSSGPAGLNAKKGVHNGGAWWHDFAIRVRGDGALGTLQNFVQRWNFEIARLSDITAFGVTAADTLDDRTLYTPAGTGPADGIATERTFPGIARIRTRYETMIQSAVNRIIIVNQYVRYRPIAQRLEQALANQAALTITIVLPSYPEEVTREDLPRIRERYAGAQTSQDQAAALAQLQAKANSIDPLNKLSLLLQNRCLENLVIHPRVKIWLPAFQPALGVALPYIHAKIMVCDDKLMTVGSANLNGRSLDATTDTEINISLDRPPGSHPGEPDVKQLIEDPRFEWHRPEPADENDAARYANSYFSRLELRRYTPRHWQADRELTKFPIGRDAILDYFLQFQNSPYVDKLLDKKLTREELGAKIDEVPSFLVDLDSPSFPDEMMDLFESIL